MTGTVSPTDARVALRRASALLLGMRDILDERVDEGPPSWCERRGWTGALLALSDEELCACEAEGLTSRAARMDGLPPSLVTLAEAIAEVVALPRLAAPPLETGPERSVRARKVPQLAALLGAVEAMARRADRIVDVGSGSGHFTRLAAETFDREALGIERNPARVAAATARAEANLGDAPGANGGVRFTLSDAGRDGLSFSTGDLAVGLHACGALGDRIAGAAAAAGCDLALVSCCLQKIDQEERAALSSTGAGLSLRRETLGLSNLTSQPVGVETTIEKTMAARKARHALLRLLRGRGEHVTAGEEMRGINRRRAHGGLREIAERALALRGLAPASAEEIRACEDEAAHVFAAVRRLSLPRNMLARLVEVTVILDRAAALQESGHHVLVATVFDRDVTPRNVGLFATREAERLPPIEGPT